MKDHAKLFPINDIEVYWNFPSNRVIVNQEYLVYDSVGMVGSVGGTLGLLLGFSFLDLMFSLVNYLQEKIIYLNVLK